MALTLSTPQLLELVFDAIKVRLPLLVSSFATDFSNESVKLNQDVIARIPTIPTVQNYDADGGYKPNAVDAKGLLSDVKVTIDQHKHVPVKMDFLDAAGTVQAEKLLEDATMNCGYALAKTVVDYALSKVVKANFSKIATFTTGNSDLDMLIAVREAMNIVGAGTVGRFGIVNSAVMSTLSGDTRIASGDYHGQRISEEALGLLKSIQGFANIHEYPDLPDNAENLSAFFGTPESIVVATRLPKDVEKIAAQANIPQIASFDTLTDEDTGLSLLGIKWIEAGTFNVYTTVTLMFGAAAGKQGGNDDSLLDNAGHRIVTA